MECCIRSFVSLQKGQLWLWALYWHDVLLLRWSRSCLHHGNNLQFSWTFHCELTSKQKIPDQKQERRGYNILIMSPKEKNGNRILQAAAAQSWIWSCWRFPVVTVDTRHLYASVQAVIPGITAAAPLESTHTEIGVIRGRSLPRRSWMQVDQAITVRE